MVSLLAALAPPATAQGTAGILKVTGPDYGDAVTEVFGSAAVNVVLTRAASDVTAQRDIIVGATARTGTDNTILFDLLESGPRTGIFVGSFSVALAPATSSDATDHPAFGRLLGDGVVRAGPGATITVNTPAPAAASTTVRWFPGDSGLVAESLTNVPRPVPVSTIAPVDDPIEGWGARIYYSILDSDLNTNTATRQTYTNALRVWSDSDAEGEKVTIGEVVGGTGLDAAGPSQDSSAFFGDVGFEAVRQPNNGKVFVQHGDNIYAKYIDLRDELGIERAIELPVHTFESASTASLQFGRSTGVGLTQPTANGLDRVGVALADLDQDVGVGPEPVEVTVNLLTGSGGTVESELCTVRLAQQGAQGAYFMMFGFTTDPAVAQCPDDDPDAGPVLHPSATYGAVMILVPEDKTEQVFQVVYDDIDLAGAAQTLTGEFRWTGGGSGVLRLGPDVEEPVSRLVGLTTPVNVRLEDLDMDLDGSVQDIVLINVYSSSDAAGGILLDARETTTDSGVFTTQFGLTTGSSSQQNRLLMVADGDFIVAEYEDRSDDIGHRRIIESQRVVWREAKDAVITFDEPDYFQSRSLGVSTHIDIRDQFGRVTRSEDEVARIIFDTNQDGTFDTETDAFIEVRDQFGDLINIATPRVNFIQEPEPLIPEMEQIGELTPYDPDLPFRRVIIMDPDGTNPPGGTNLAPTTFGDEDDGDSSMVWDVVASEPIIGEDVTSVTVSGGPSLFEWNGHAGNSDEGNNHRTSRLDVPSISSVVFDDENDNGDPRNRNSGEFNPSNDPVFSFRSATAGVDHFEEGVASFSFDVDGSGTGDAVTYPIGYRPGWLTLCDPLNNRIEEPWRAPFDASDDPFHTIEPEHVATMVIGRNVDCFSNALVDPYIQFQNARGVPVSLSDATRSQVVFDEDGVMGKAGAVTLELATECEGDANMMTCPLSFETATGAPIRQVASIARILLDGEAIVEFVDSSGNVVSNTAATRAGYDWTADAATTTFGSVIQFPRTQARIFVEDPDQNDPRVRDFITVQVATNVGPLDPGYHTIEMELAEIGVDSGIFTNILQFSLLGAHHLTGDPVTINGALQPSASGRLDMGPAEKVSQEFVVRYDDDVAASGLGQLFTSTPVMWRNTGVTPGGEIPNPGRFIRVEEDNSVLLELHDRVPIEGGGGDTRTYDIVMYGPIGLTSDQLQVEFHTPRGADICGAGFDTITRSLSDDFQGDPVNDGRYAGSVTFRTVNSRGIVDVNGIRLLGDCSSSQVGVSPTANGGTDVTAVAAGAPAISLKAAPSTNGPIRAVLEDDRELGPSVPAVGQEARAKIKATSPFFNEDSRSRDTFWATASTASDPSGINVLLVETGPNTNQFEAAVAHTEGLESSDPRTAELLVQSELQGDWGYPEHLADRARNDDVVTITGAGTTRYYWVDGNAGILSAGGSQATPGALEVVLRGDDVLTDRVTGEIVSIPYAPDSTGRIQFPRTRLFTLSQPYVPGSEKVYDIRDERPLSEFAFGTEYQVAAAGSAAEPIADRNGDAVVDCDDIIIRTDPSGEAGIVSGCIDVDAENGIIEYDCVDCSSDHSIEYMYRLGLGDGSSPYEYSRPTPNQIRLGSSPSHPDQCPNVSSNDPFDTGKDSAREDLCPWTDTEFTVDYTPAKHNVMAINPGKETEKITVEWDDTRGLYVGNLGVERVRIPNNGKVFVEGSQADLTFRFDDPFVETGLAAPTNIAHFDAIIARATWRVGGVGLVSFHDPSFASTVTGTVSGPGIPVQVRDHDADRTPFRDVVVVRASSGADFVHIVLVETGQRTAVFQGVVSAQKVTSSAAIDLENGILDILLPPGTTNTASVVVGYSDPAGVDGRPKPVTGSIGWRPAEDATIQLFSDSNRQTPILAGDVLSGGDATVYIRIVDADSNRNDAVAEDIKIRVVSAADPAGEEFNLSESNSLSGVFDSGPIRFESSLTANNGRVFVRNAVKDTADEIVRDAVRVLYDDPIGVSGERNPVHSDDFFVDPRTDGAVVLEAPFYVGTADDLGDPGERALAFATVAEGECNKRPYAVEIINAANTDCPLSGFDLKIGVPSKTLVTPSMLVETGSNTGMFLALFSFTDAGAVTDAPIPLAPVSNGDQVRVQYTDATPAVGTAAKTFTDTATWQDLGFGVVQFDRDGYNDISLQPRITLIDGDLDTSASVDRPTVSIRSAQADHSIQVQLTETGARTGIFEGSITLTESSSPGSGTLRVRQLDTIEVVYEDSSPTGQRSATADIGIGAVTPPVTMLVLEPEEASGLRGVYTAEPSFVLIADKEVTLTEFRVGEVGAFVPFLGSVTLLEGANVVQFRSIDTFGNQEALKERVVDVDLTDPLQIPTNLTAQPAKGGAIALNWTGVAVTSDPFNFWEYAIYRDGDLNTPMGNTTTPGFVDSTLVDEIEHSYVVKVRDKSGRAGPVSSVVSAIPDATLPELDSATVSPSSFDTRANPGNVSVSVVATDLNLAEVTAELRQPSGDAVASVTLSAGNGSIFGGALDVSGVDQPCLCDLVFLAKDVAGNVANVTLPFEITGPDTQAPTIRFAGVNAAGRLRLGVPIQVTVADNVGLDSVAYQVDGGRFIEVPLAAEGQPVVTFTVPTIGMILGEHTLGVVANDTATDLDGNLVPNQATNITEFELIPGDGPGGAGSFFLKTTARARSDGTVLVSWEVPDELLSAGIAGFQVWRASSPFEEVHRTTNPAQRTFIDDTATEDKDYRYVASFFTPVTGAFASIADVPGYPGSDDQVPASAGVNPTEAGGLPGWLWVIIIAVAILAVAALVAVAIASRRSPRQTQVQQTKQVPPEETDEDDGVVTAEEDRAAYGPSAEETHRLKCPECQHRFEVTGSKPIVTNCPNCGRKGILR